jgi:transposase
MTSVSSITGTVWVAIDVAKASHQVLVELPDGPRRSMRIANTASEIKRFVTYLRALQFPCRVAFEPTGDYHRAVMHLLGRAGLSLCQVSSVAVARTRDALYNSWDKNDPRDAQVILHLLKTGPRSGFWIH